MKTIIKISLSAGSAVIVSLIGYGLAGLLGCVMGFILTWFLIGLFSIWRKCE